MIWFSCSFWGRTCSVFDVVPTKETISMQQNAGAQRAGLCSDSVFPCFWFINPVQMHLLLFSKELFSSQFSTCSARGTMRIVGLPKCTQYPLAGKGWGSKAVTTLFKHRYITAFYSSNQKHYTLFQHIVVDKMCYWWRTRNHNKLILHGSSMGSLCNLSEVTWTTIFNPGFMKVSPNHYQLCFIPSWPYTVS